MAEERKKISSLPLAEQLDGTESIPMLKNGGNPRATLADLKEYFSDSTLAIFDEIDSVANPTVSDSVLSDEDGATFAIVYLSSKQVFVERKTLGGSHYYSSSFIRKEHFMEGTYVRKDRVFFNASDKQLYVYDTTLSNIFDSVRIHAMTEEEFANLENPIEGAFYATYE